MQENVYTLNLFFFRRGATENQGFGEHSDVIREATVEVKSLISCYEANEVRDIISERAFCVGGDGTGPCFGDSGGGFVSLHNSTWFLRGVISSGVVNGAGHCDVNKQAVITNLAKFIGWIKSIVNGGAQLNCDFPEPDYPGVLVYRECNLKNDKSNTHIAPGTKDMKKLKLKVVYKFWIELLIGQKVAVSVAMLLFSAFATTYSQRHHGRCRHADFFKRFKRTR